MELICEGCQAVIQIPDERVPQNSTFRLHCPRCKQKIVASTKTPEHQEDTHTNVSLTSSAVEVTSAAAVNPDEDLPEVMDSLPPDQSAALLCVNREEAHAELKTILEGLGYVVDSPAAADRALQRLRFNQYRVILLDDDFEGKSPNPVAEYLAGLNMNIRRDMFVVLIGQRFKTADHLQAFIESVNLILHPDDLPQLATFLARGMNDQERFYKVFTESLIEAGKKI
jgi:CheY-like chemotaxis protein